MTAKNKRRVLLFTATLLIAAAFGVQGVNQQAIEAGYEASPIDYGCLAATMGGPSLGKSQKIKAYGYSIRPLKTWNSIPAQPGQKTIVGSWSPDLARAQKRGDFSSYGCGLQIRRFEKGGGITTTNESEAKDKEEEEAEKKRKAEEKKRLRGLEKIRMRMNPKNIEEWLEGQFENAAKRYVPKAIKAGKLKGKLIEFTGGRTAYCIGVFERDGFEWGVIYTAPEAAYKKNWKKIYTRSIKSFRLIGTKGRIERTVAVKDLKKLSPEKRRAALKSQIKGNPGWYAIDSKNYVFLSNSKNKSFVKSLSKQIEALRKAVYEKMFPPQVQITTVCTVRVLSTQSEYYQYGGPRGSAGYWNSRKEELVLFDSFDGLGKKKSRAATRSVMYHEAFHQYIHYAVGELAPHPWFNEGHGDYFAGARISGSKVGIGTFEWRTDYLKRLLRDDGNSLIPTRSLIRLPQSEYYNNAGMKYSQGWAFVYYLRKVTKNKKWSAALDTYFDYLSENVASFKKKKKEKEDEDDGKSGPGGDLPGLAGITVVDWEDQEKIKEILETAVDKAFDGIDLEKLDKSFERWVRSL
ncbi:MAG: hypothetical protein V3W41_05770 [Planctomycetota bacterium]